MNLNPSTSVTPKKHRRQHFERLEVRQLLSAAAASVPFTGAPINAGQTIEAENFDLGGPGVGYQVANPATPPPDGTSYRTETDVEIDPGDSNGPTTGDHVANLTAGDWLQYTINVPVAGAYDVSAQYSAPDAGAAIHFDFDGTVNTSSVALDATDAASTGWGTAQSNAVSLTAGVHVMEVMIDGNVNALTVTAELDWFNVTAVPSVPYTGTPIVAGQTMEAENFDLGGPAVGYQVANPAAPPTGASYRTETDVEIDAGDFSGPTSGDHVTSLSAGDWLQYTIDVPVGGNYIVDARYSAPADGAAIHFGFDGTLNSKSVSLGTTTAWTNWYNATSSTVPLTAGVHVMDVVIDKNVDGMNVSADLDSFNLTAAASIPFTGAPIDAGQTVEAEKFDYGGAGVGYQVANPAAAPNGFRYRAEIAVEIDAGDSNGPTVGDHVADLSAGDWLQYTINVPVAGNYVVDTRYSAPAAGAAIHVSFDQTLNTSSITLGATPGWTSWHTAEGNAVPLTAGVHVMRVLIDHNVTGQQVSADFDWFNLTAVATTPTTLTWKAAAVSPVKTYEGAAEMVNGLLYTFGGFPLAKPTAFNQSYQVYNPATNVWTKLGTIPGAQTHSGVAVDDSTGIIYFVGGFYGTATSYQIVNTVYAYSTSTNTWSQLPSMPVPVGAGEAAVVDGKLHYFGGNQGTDMVTDHADHWVLDLSQVAAGTATWQSAAPLPTARVHANAVVFDNKIYSFGGETGHEVYHRQQSDNYVYDPATDTWTTLAPIPIPRSHAEAASFVYDGKIIIAGGQVDDSVSTASMLEYDPASDRWFILPSLPEALQGEYVQPWGNELIATNGYVGITGKTTGNTWIAQWPIGAAVPTPIPPKLTETPFLGTPFTTNQTIEAENYDNGGEGLGYHDTATVDAGGATYRAGDPVGVQAGGSNGFDVGFVVVNEWLRYTLTVPTSGSYDLQASAAQIAKGGTFHADFGGGIVSAAVAVPVTGNWQKYQTVTSAPITLAAGSYVMQIDMDKNATDGAVGNFDWFKLVPAPAPPAPVAPKPVVPAPTGESPFAGKVIGVNQTIEAENYNLGGSGVAYHDTSTVDPSGSTYRPGNGVGIEAGGSNGFVVGYTAAGEWLDYSVNVTVAGTYRLQASVANTAAGGAFHGGFGNGIVSPSIAVGTTSGWQTYHTVTSGAFTLAAGQFVMRIYFDKTGSNGAVGNFDWFKLVSAT